MKILCISNGHGEDGIALQILRSLRQAEANVVTYALPIVGKGDAYQRSGIPLVGPTKILASGGFLYMDSQQLVRDLKSGLVGLTLGQLRAIRSWVKSERGCVLAVGDIVPLLFAWWSGVPYAFVGTAKSEYYLRDESGPLARPTWQGKQESAAASVYLPWERWLMARRRCRGVFPRDRLTTERLHRWRIPAFNLGNPMMDDLQPRVRLQWEHSDAAATLTVALLPGSRPPEVYHNWQVMLETCHAWAKTDKPVSFLAAIAPSVATETLESALLQQGWQRAKTSLENPHRAGPYPTYALGKLKLALVSDAYPACLHQADLGVAMAGTATEQLVGLGKPVVTLPGRGPQFTPAFAEAQTRLLGCSILHQSDPAHVPRVVQQLMGDRPRLEQIQANGIRRMGPPGAADRIAQKLLEVFQQI